MFKQLQILGDVSDRTKLHTLLFLSQTCHAGLHVLTRFILAHGLNQYISAAYRCVLADLVLFLLAYLMERDKRPRLTKFTFAGFVLSGFLQTCYIQTSLWGIHRTSAGFSSVILNLISIFVFLMAAILRLESVHITRKDGLAKTFGTLLSVVGAIFMVNYKGPAVLPRVSSSSMDDHPTPGSWQLGALSLTIGCFSQATYIIIQPYLLRACPPIFLVAGTTFFTATFVTVMAAAMEPNISSWKLHDPAQIIWILYGGIIVSGFVVAVWSWGIKRPGGGPVIVSAYQTLDTTLVIFLGTVILKESLFLGSVIGAILVISGIYLLAWGKAEDKKATILEAPLLESEGSSLVP